MNLSWEEFHLERLLNTEKALLYLNAALNDPDEDIFLIALRDVSKAHLGGMTALAEKTDLSRESLYRTLSLKGNPRFSTLLAILDALGFQLALEPKKRKKKAAKKVVRGKGKTISKTTRSRISRKRRKVSS